MVTKRAQNRQQKNLQKVWQNQKTSLNQSLPIARAEIASLQMSLPDSQQSEMQQAIEQLQQSPDWQNMSKAEQESMLVAFQAMEQDQIAGLSDQMPRTRRKYQKKATGSGDISSDEETNASELLAPLTGKHLRQQKEIQELAGAVALGLIAAAKTAKSATLALDAQTVAKYGEDIAVSWARLGRKYSYIYSLIDKICAGSVIAVALAPMSAMLSELASNHGVEIPIIGKSNKAA